MANSNGIDYFSFNVDFFDDDKLALIEGEFGIKGAYIAIRLLCKIYKEGYYYQWGDDECLLFSRKVGAGIASDLVKEVVKGLVKRSFFDKGVFERFQILTSRGIQSRYFEAVKRRQCVEARREFLLIDVSKFPNVHILEENVNIDKTNADISPQSKLKESILKETPPQTPPHGGASSTRGGRTTSSPSSEKYFDIKSALRGKPGVNENDVWETMRLTENGKESSIGLSLVKQWLENPSMCNFYEILQKLQEMERTGKIKVMSHENYFIYVFLLVNLTQSDADSIRLYIKDPRLFEECKKLIAEIKKGRINQPGKFLLKKLRECQEVINKQNLKLK